MGLFIYSTSQHLIDATYLNNCLGPRHLKYLPTPLSPIGEGEVDDLSILGELVGVGGRAAQRTLRSVVKLMSPPRPSLIQAQASLPAFAQTLLETNLRG